MPNDATLPTNRRLSLTIDKQRPEVQIFSVESSHTDINRESQLSDKVVDKESKNRFLSNLSKE